MHAFTYSTLPPVLGQITHCTTDNMPDNYTPRAYHGVVHFRGFRVQPHLQMNLLLLETKIVKKN